MFTLRPSINHSVQQKWRLVSGMLPKADRVFCDPKPVLQEDLVWKWESRRLLKAVATGRGKISGRFSASGRECLPRSGVPLRLAESTAHKESAALAMGWMSMGCLHSNKSFHVKILLLDKQELIQEIQVLSPRSHSMEHPQWHHADVLNGGGVGSHCCIRSIEPWHSHLGDFFLLLQIFINKILEHVPYWHFQILERQLS